VVGTTRVENSDNTPAMLITLPAVYGIDYFIKGNPVRQIAVHSSRREGILAPFTRGSLKAFVFQPALVDEEVLIVRSEAKRLPDGHQRILRATVPVVLWPSLATLSPPIAV